MYVLRGELCDILQLLKSKEIKDKWETEAIHTSWHVSEHGIITCQHNLLLCNKVENHI